MKNLKYINLFILSAFLLIIILMLNDKLRFGFGLGDLAYLFLSGGSLLIMGILLIVNHQSRHDYSLKILVPFAGILLYIMYILIFSAGPEIS